MKCYPPPAPPTINRLPSPSDGAVDLPYGFTLTAHLERDGVLPPGLTFTVVGLLSGTPTTTGTFPITVKVKDALGAQPKFSVGASAQKTPSLITTQ